MPLPPDVFRRKVRARKRAYERVFESPDGIDVLADLMEHCGWGRDLFNENPYTMANLVGRRHAILHIKAILKQTDEQIERIVNDRYVPEDEK